MALLSSCVKKTFHFNFKARTSRGLMKDKASWFIKLWDDANPQIYGVGECSPLPGLSPDSRPDFEAVVKETLNNLISSRRVIDWKSIGNIPALGDLVPPGFSSLRFGLETALLDLANGGKRIIFNNDFLTGKKIPINGLIWMGDIDFTMGQISKKIAEGFRCIKLKVGGLDFDRECDILEYVRKRYFREDILIRLDANGAFKVDEVLFRLEQLSKYKIHSIEQPLKPGLQEMEALCRKSPIPVALDEELIGIERKEDKVKLLERLQPPFIILKPSLHGGLSGCSEWIEIATTLSIGWWITSALESNVGLNAICQFTANYTTDLYQGLGTGSIYEDNIASPLRVEKGNIFQGPSQQWDVETIEFSQGL